MFIQIFFNCVHSFTGGIMPEWYSAKKWIEIAQKVPEIINSGMDNMLNVMYHIQIPYSYWENKFPKDEFKTELERQAKIEEACNTLEEKFTSPENAKTLIIFFGGELQEDKWSIDVTE